MLGFKLLLLL